MRKQPLGRERPALQSDVCIAQVVRSNPAAVCPVHAGASRPHAQIARLAARAQIAGLGVGQAAVQPIDAHGRPLAAHMTRQRGQRHDVLPARAALPFAPIIGRHGHLRTVLRISVMFFGVIGRHVLHSNSLGVGGVGGSTRRQLENQSMCKAAHAMWRHPQIRWSDLAAWTRRLAT